ncbi:Putative cytochrome P450 [Septoria linicola]|uniref:Cytochrome P450 n=1 Tax=Septoria linicola TaxID=215465 RepID=A0A9Q9AK21_9PEZI|nr:putative cytochrome P450 [Septoria linicola]USW50827.1 Putative cytochrome P450 [Septoria linicola]
MSRTSFLSGSPLNVLAFVLLPAALVLYISGIVIYRIFFHPLSKYPGPLLAKVTDLYSTYHALRGDRHLEFYRTHEKYGRIVRFGPNSLSFNSATALKEIYGFKSNVRKARFYEAFWATKDSFSTHSAISKSVHARKRRVLSQAFSDAAIKSMENHILAHVRQFCQNLAGDNSLTTFASAGNPENKGYGAPVEISDQANYLTFDIMGDLCFGKAFGMLERPDNRFAIDLIGNAAHRHLICGTYLPIHSYHLDKLFFRKIAAGRARYMQYSKAQAGERMKMGSDVDRKDFFYYLLKAKDPETGNGFTTPELWGESNLLIIAGSDTTSTALAAAVFYLVHNPAKLEKLAKEVRAAFGDVEEIRIGPALAGLHYLRAVIDEAMRLSPSVGGLLPREVLAGGMEIDGEQIPEGTVVGVPHYTVQHNEAYYPGAFEFKPERWIAGSEPGITAESVAIVQSAFCPFSVGPRGCIGKGMAYNELMLSLARAIYMYDMRLAPGCTVGEGKPELEYGRQRRAEFQLKDTFTSMKEGPLVQFRSRL